MSLSELVGSLELGLIYGVVSMGIYLTFRIISFTDLTCDGSFMAGAASTAAALKAGFSAELALVMGALVGGAAGLVTGALHIYGRISVLLSGILTAFMLYSLNLKIMGGIPNIALYNVSTLFHNGYGVLVLLGISMCFVFILGYILMTDFGLALISVGQNQKLASLNGVNISFFTLIALVISNALIGMGGGLFCQHQGFADISQGIGTIIIGLAGIMVGEKLFPFRSLWISLMSCLVGSIVYRLIIAMALHSDVLGLESSDLNLITGTLLVAIMVLPKYRRGTSC